MYIYIYRERDTSDDTNAGHQFGGAPIAIAIGSRQHIYICIYIYIYINVHLL